MAGVIINVTVSHGGSLMGELDDSLDDSGLERYVIHGANACGPCQANKNPDNVPCAACTGNTSRIDPDDGKGNLCQCKVGVRRKDGRNRD
jgi:hypothetical protein